MEGNKEEALRALSIAQRHRNASNLTSALKFARKSVQLYETPEGTTMVSIIEREIELGGEGSSSNSASGSGMRNGGASPPTPGTPTSSSARATGVEEHVSSARERHPKKAAAGGGEKEKEKEKKTYTTKQIEVVTRVTKCRHHQYYEILSIERTCSENDVKRAYKKLALALHPDKNNAPGADEAFKMVSKAFQVLSDKGLRAAYDSNPTVDPTQRGGGGGGGFSSAGMRGFGGHPGFQGGGFEGGDINAEDLFNMFFGGGGGGMNGGFGGGSGFGGPRVYTFGGGGGRGHPFQQARRARAQAAGGDMGPSSPLMAFLPIAMLAFFVLFSLLPQLFGDNTPDPGYTFRETQRYDMGRHTWQRNIPYFVNKPEWEGSAIWQSVPEQHRNRKDAALYSSKLRGFERNVEETQIRHFQQECHNFNINKQRAIAEEAGVFGWGADQEKIRQLRAQNHKSCEQLRKWGVSQHAY